MYLKTWFFSVFLLCIILQSSSSQTWINRFNGTANSTDISRKIYVDNSGNSYITGYSTNLITNRDITTIKYNPAGVQLWASSYNGSVSGNDEAYAITVDNAGNVYVAGSSFRKNSNNDIVLIKYNSSGSEQWAATHTGSGFNSDEAYAITLDNAGNPIIAGYSYESGFGIQLTVIKYNTQGVEQWVSNYNGTPGETTDEAYAITIDNAGGGIYVCGVTEDNSGNSDFVTIKYNSSGVQQWVKNYNGPGNQNDEAYAITIDNNGNIFVTGESEGAGTGKDYATIKYNTSGVQQWVQRYNNQNANSDDIPNAVIVAVNNDILVTGSSKSSAASGSEDYLTIRYNQSGDTAFTFRYNGTINSTDIGYAIIVPNSNNAIFITGSSKTTNGQGGEDIVTLKLNPAGTQIQKNTISNPGTDCAFDIKLNSSEDMFLAGYMEGNGTGSDMTIAEYNGGSLITTISQLSNNIPNSFKLYQNYPNPFNPTSIFKFDIPENTYVKVSVYDALGREIFSPINENLKAGNYEVSVTMNAYSSGIYFYKMTAGSFMDIKKMILIK